MSESDSDSSSEDEAEKYKKQQQDGEDMARRMGATVINIDEMMAKQKLEPGYEEEVEPPPPPEKPRSKGVKVSKKAAEAWLSPVEEAAKEEKEKEKEDALKLAKDADEKKQITAAKLATAKTKAEADAMAVAAKARAGDPKAMARFGSMLMQSGQTREAVKMWELAASKGSATAANNLACAMLEGCCGEPDMARVASLLRVAADGGVADAQCTLAEMLIEGADPDQTKIAVGLLEQAVKQKHPDAAFTLGQMYFHGGSVEPDWPRAAALFGVAAKQNHPDAAYNLGVMLGTGRGVTPNRDEAFKLFQQAAKAGHPKAIEAIKNVQGMDH